MESTFSTLYIEHSVASGRREHALIYQLLTSLQSPKSLSRDLTGLRLPLHHPLPKIPTLKQCRRRELNLLLRLVQTSTSFTARTRRIQLPRLPSLFILYLPPKSNLTSFLRLYLLQPLPSPRSSLHEVPTPPWLPHHPHLLPILSMDSIPQRMAAKHMGIWKYWIR